MEYQFIAFRTPLSEAKSGEWKQDEEANLIEEIQRAIIEARNSKKVAETSKKSEKIEKSESQESESQKSDKSKEPKESKEPPAKKRRLDDNTPSTSSPREPEAEKNTKAKALRDNINKKITEPFQVNSDESSSLTMTIWDFGGQDDFIATHHLFLDVEPTNVIVMDMSKNLTDKLNENVKPEHPNSPADFMHYWLNFIYFQAKKKGVRPNVALVLTHLDKIQEDEKDGKIRSILKAIKFKEEKPTPYSELISRDNTYVISNTRGSNDDFEKLKQQLLSHLMKQDSFKIEIPVRWLQLEAILLGKATQESKQHLSYSDVKHQASVSNIAEEELQDFLKTYHSLGVFLYYSDPESETYDDNIVITDPQWLPDVCKTLITTHEFLDERKKKKEMSEPIVEHLKKGTVTKDDLKKLWGEDEVNLIVRVMKKFHLIAPLDSTGKNYVIPCMLPSVDGPMYIPPDLKKIDRSKDIQPDFKKIEEILGVPKLEQDEIPFIGLFPSFLSHVINTLTASGLLASPQSVEHLHYNSGLLKTRKGMIVSLKRHLKVELYDNKNTSQNSDQELTRDGIMQIHRERDNSTGMFLIISTLYVTTICSYTSD